MTTWGGYAEYVKTPARCTMPIPDNLSFHEATVIGRHLGTASSQVEAVLGERGRLAPGDGRLGGLGAVCIQVAKWNGANVIAAAGTDEGVAAAMGVGADHGINYRTQDLTEEVRRITDGKGVNGVCETVADPELFPKVIYSMAQGAKLVTAGYASGNFEVPLDIRYLYLNQLHIIGEPREQPGGLAKAFERAATGDVKTIIDKVFPLSQAADAQRRVLTREGIGKVVIDPTLV